MMMMMIIDNDDDDDDDYDDDDISTMSKVIAIIKSPTSCYSLQEMSFLLFMSLLSYLMCSTPSSLALCECCNKRNEYVVRTSGGRIIKIWSTCPLVCQLLIITLTTMTVIIIIRMVMTVIMMMMTTTMI